MILEFDIFPESFSAITNKKKKNENERLKKNVTKKKSREETKKVVSNYNMT